MKNIDKHKQILLETKMNELGLGGAFNKLFTGYRYDSISQSEVLTLREFFEENKSLVYSNEYFYCKKYKLEYGSASHKKLIKFLLDNSFTYKDWINLVPKVRRPQGGETYDISLLSKEQILGCGLPGVTGIKTSSDFFREVLNKLYPERERGEINKVTVSQFLKLDLKDFEVFFGYSQTIESRFNKTLYNIQSTLRKLGFDKNDGVFMEMYFSNKTKEDIIEELVRFKNFDKKEAILAVELGLKAGFIQI